MEEDIIEIINQQNISMSELNDEEIAILSEQCFDIISQFHNINIDEFSFTFNEIITQLIEEDEDDEDDIDIDEIENKMQESYFKNLDEMEQSLLESLQEIRDLKREAFGEYQVKQLMKLPQPEQRSQAWYDMRYNMITASDIGAIIGYSKYQNRMKILRKKCGLGPPFTGNFHTRHGQMFEPIATDIYATRNFTTVHEFGLIQHPKISFIGASPDGITVKGRMLEIKCPSVREINGNVLDPKTKAYYAQIQTQLEVCNLEYCDFFECKILELPGGLQQYLNDKFIPENITSMNIIPRQQYSLDYVRVPNCRRSSNGQEKGILIKYQTHDQSLDDPEWKFDYPNFMDTTEKQLEWLELQHKKDYREIREIFWKIELTSTCLVKRDRDWWNKYLPELDSFWKEVLHRRRNNDYDDIKPKKRKSKKSQSTSKLLDLSGLQIKPMKDIPQHCTIYPSSDEN